MAWRNVDETTQVYAMDEAVIFIAYNDLQIGGRFNAANLLLYLVCFNF